MSPEDTSLDNQNEARDRVEVLRSYSVTDEIPKDPEVTLLFEGLMWFIFHGQDECQVGIHNTTYGVPHNYPHEFAMNMWTIKDRDYSRCPPPIPVPLGNPKTITGIQIDVNNPVQEGIYVFQHPKGKEYDAKDWRWVIDFDREPLYPEGVQLITRNLTPGVSINHGVFYTLSKTTSEFSLIQEGPTGPTGPYVELGSVAQFVGCNIKLKPGGDVTLLVRRAFPHESTKIKLEPRTGYSHQLDIANVCIKQGKRCDFEAGSGDPNKWNDFYLYYDTCIQPGSTRKYRLKRTKPGPPPTAVRTFCVERHGQKDHIESSNEAPCGPVTAGGGGGGG